MLNKIKLPFNLFCDLKVTQYRGKSGSHATGNAIDFAPLISNVSHEKAVAIYVATYMRLFSHLKFGLLRINESKSCWHYHFYASRNWYHSGVEHYSWDGSRCVQFAESENINATQYGHLAKLSYRIGRVQDYLLDAVPIVDVFTPSFWRHFYQQLKITELPETFIYYDSAMISQNELLNILSPFSSSVQWTPINSMLPVSPQGKDELLGAGAGLALLGLVAVLLLNSEGKQVSKSKNIYGVSR